MQVCCITHHRDGSVMIQMRLNACGFNTVLPMVTRSARWDPMYLLLRTISFIVRHRFGHVPIPRSSELSAMNWIWHSSEDELSELKIQTAFMKQHRSLIQYGTFYRLSSPFENNITAWMAVSEDRTEALVGWYRTLNVANGPFTRLYLQGLEESDLYNVTEYTEGHESAVSTHYGDELMNLGLITSDASSGQYMDGRRESCDFDSRLFYVQKQAE